MRLDGVLSRTSRLWLVLGREKEKKFAFFCLLCCFEWLLRLVGASIGRETESPLASSLYRSAMEYL